MNAAYYIVKPADVGKEHIWFGGVRYDSPLGIALPGDVGKRCYQRGDILQVENDEQRRVRQCGPVDLPRGGDAVRLAAPWAFATGLAAGSIGIIDGRTDTPRADVAITFNYSAFIGQSYSSPEHCSASGGPGSIITPAAELKPTGETVTVRAWMWKDGTPQAHNGADYQRECRLWDWFPDTHPYPKPTAEDQARELAARIERCRRFGYVTPSGIVWDEELASSAGMSFELFREAHHTDEDIAAAKKWLRSERDVVSIHITKLA